MFQIGDKLLNKRVLVIGDVMLDEYIVGDKYYISNEAPVPILKADRFEVRLGGAANVANNIKMLGCEVTLLGTIGHGYSGQRFLNLLDAQDIASDNIISSVKNLTTTKTRVLIKNQQIVRYDYEKTTLDDDVANLVYQKLQKLDFKNFEVIIIEDYNKGLISGRMMDFVKESFCCPIFVDPKLQNIDFYNNVFCLKPNKIEFAQIAGLEEDFSEDLLFERGKEVIDRMSLECLVVTLGERGCFVCDKNGCKIIEAHRREIVNAIGAGDTFIAAIAVAHVSGFDIFNSVKLANLASSIAISKEYTNVCSAEELQQYHD